MNYKEKYNQALKRARIEYKNEQSKGNIWVCENLSTIFPELRESEDERIRKEIIDFIQEREIVCSNGDSFLPYKKWIAWLEKQGEQDALKDLPKWKKAEKDEVLDWVVKFNKNDNIILSDVVYKGEYFIMLQSLKILPKEE